jgi:hypothetical protein
MISLKLQSSNCMQSELRRLGLFNGLVGLDNVHFYPSHARDNVLRTRPKSMDTILTRWRARGTPV